MCKALCISLNLYAQGNLIFFEISLIGNIYANICTMKNITWCNVCMANLCLQKRCTLKFEMLDLALCMTEFLGVACHVLNLMRTR